MRIATFVLGLLGAIVGLGVSFFVIEAASFGAALKVSSGQELLGLSLLAIVAVILAIVGASFSLVRKRKWAGWLLLVSGLVGFLAISAYWIPSGVLILVASLLAFLDKGDRKQNVAPTGLSQ